jgi:hypothetical protein
VQTDLIAALRHISIKQTAVLTLATAVTAFGAVSVARADGGPTRNAKPTITKNCNIGNYTGCIAGYNSHAGGTGVYGSATSGGVGVYGIANGGFAGEAVGVLAQGPPNAYGLFALTGAGGIAIYGNEPTSSGNYVLWVTGGGNGSVAFDDNGNAFLSGQVYTSGACQSGCSRTRHVESFGARTSEPTIDDVGEAALRSGAAHVVLDPAFANAIDGSKPYVVLVTPEGEANNIYVTNRTSRGFDVREARGGHASIGFAYRIVAKPYGVKDQRLPFRTEPMAPPAPRAIRH